MIRKTRSHNSDRVPPSYTEAFMYQKQVSVKGKFGGNYNDYRNERVVFGYRRGLSSYEIFNYNQARVNANFLIIMRYNQLSSALAGDRLLSLNDLKNVQSFRIQSYIDKNARQEYVNFLVDSNSFQTRAQTSGQIAFPIFKGDKNELTRIKSGNISFIIRSLHMDLISNFDDFFFITSEAGISPMLAFYQRDFDDDNLIIKDIVNNNESCELTKLVGTEQEGLVFYACSEDFLSKENSVYKIERTS